MNIMIISPGRRVEVVEFFKKEFSKVGGKVFAADMSKYAPALYVANEFFVVEKDFNNLDSYINKLIEICLDKKIKAIISFIDPELELLSKNKDKFKKNGIEVIVSDFDIIKDTFDKFYFYEKYKNEIPVVPTYKSVQDALISLEKGEIKMPLFCKKRKGSGSEGIGKIETIEILKTYSEEDDFIFQPFSKTKEFGVDAYIDMIDGDIKNYFIKEKLLMRAGETDKSISVKRSDIQELITKVSKLGDFRGPIDIDIFEDSQGNLFVNEINPRFGGGYIHAHKCGVNFIAMIINNLNKNINVYTENKYKEDIVMMKYAGSLIY